MSNENLKKSTIGASKAIGRPAGGVQRGAYGATMALGGAREAASNLADSTAEPHHQGTPSDEQPSTRERGFFPQFTRAQARKTDDDDGNKQIANSKAIDHNTNSRFPDKDVKFPDKEAQFLVECPNNIFYSEREIDCFRELVKYLVTNVPFSLPYIFKWIHAKDHPTISIALIKISILANNTMGLLSALIESEFAAQVATAQQQYEHILVPETGPLNQCLKHYFQIIGGDYMLHLLQKFSQQVISEKKISFEIEPNKIVTTAELENNVGIFNSRLDALVQHLTSPKSLALMPPGMRLACRAIHEIAIREKPSQSNSPFPEVGGVLFRWINAGISSISEEISSKSHKGMSAISKRNFVLILKALQALSVGAVNSREPWLSVILSQTSIKAIQNWYSQVIDIQFNPGSIHENVQFSISPTEYYTVNSVLCMFKEEILQVSRKKDRLSFTGLMDRVGTKIRKQSFLNLEDNDQKVVKSYFENRLGEEILFTCYLGVSKVAKKAKNNETIKVVLVISLNRLTIFSRSAKILHSVHLLNVKTIRSESTLLEFMYMLGDKNQITSILGETDKSEDIISAFYRAFTYNFPSFPIKQQCLFEITPSHRLDAIVSANSDVVEPCDGILPTYRSLCDYYDVAPVDYVVWDLKHLFENENTLDFARYMDNSLCPLNDKQILALFHAVAFNKQIKTLLLSKIKVTDLFFNTLTSTFCYIHHINSFSFSEIVFRSGHAIDQFFLSLIDKERLITVLDLNGTQLDEKAALGLKKYLLSCTHSFVKFDFTGTFIKSEAIKHVISAFKDNKAVTAKLTTLLWGKTKFVDMQTDELFTAMTLAQCEQLSLVETTVKFNQLFQCLTNGRYNCLQKLDLSSCQYNKDKDWLGITDMLNSKINRTLTELNICNTSVPVPVLLQILTTKTGSLRLNASNNSLGQVGATAIGEIGSRIKAFVSLDLSNNNFGDIGLISLLKGLCNNTSINVLDISYNFDGTKGESIRKLVQQLAFLVKSICPLQELYMRGNSSGRLGELITKFILTLARNGTIKVLDISGHFFTDTGAIAMSQVIRQNKCLAELKYDENNIGLVGFLNLSSALKINKSLLYVQFPVIDAGKLLVSPPAGVDRQEIIKLFSKMESRIL